LDEEEKNMNKIVLKKLVVLFFLGLVVVWTAATGAKAFSGVSPPVPLMNARNPVSLTGTFLPMQDRDKVRSPYTYTVNIEGKKWLFVVKNAVRPGDIRATVADIFNDAVFPEMSFVGDERVIAPLKNPDIVGKTLQLNGFLYPSTGRMYVSSVKTI
jgi:hypothetical protein